MSGITRQRRANIKLTTKLQLTGGKAKACGKTDLVQSDDFIEIEDMTLNQTFCDSVFFIYKTLKLKEVTISKIDKKAHTAHLKATIELSDPKCEVNKDADTSTRWGSFFASKAPGSRVESVDMDVPFETNENESKVKVRFSTMGLSQKITATII